VRLGIMKGFEKAGIRISSSRIIDAFIQKNG